mmetsp:Transcript_23750/g.33221  ORF Transcript_23750/g.33221 Transcript_23750/m.33221 type:complete len:288 (+) Transcript_23750:554-1417(+)
MFLREIFEINSWNSYKCFIIDEIHERTLEIDLILGLLKSIQKVSIGMKIILMSATISVNKLLDFFCNSVYLRIEGRIMSVCIKWIKEFNIGCFDMVIPLIWRLIRKSAGHILVFLPGQEEIDMLLKMLKLTEQKIAPTLKFNKKFIILPFYSRLPKFNQNLIFQEMIQDCCKCILSTNIAETSLTINNVKFVIDSGLQKLLYFFPHILVSSLKLALISKSSAIQRSGRAGRTISGVCFRLYTKDFYLKEMVTLNVAEIKRVILSDMILLIKTFKVSNCHLVYCSSKL